MSASKNQRSGPKKAQRVRDCEQMHVLERVKITAVFGHARLFWRCECGLRGQA